MKDSLPVQSRNPVPCYKSCLQPLFYIPELPCRDQNRISNLSVVPGPRRNLISFQAGLETEATRSEVARKTSIWSLALELPRSGFATQPNVAAQRLRWAGWRNRSEEHTSELQSRF